jgi:hypothetical protein
MNYFDYIEADVKYTVEFKVGNMFRNFSFNGPFFSNQVFNENPYIRAYGNIVLLMGTYAVVRAKLPNAK